jgi:hypothetical protein
MESSIDPYVHFQAELDNILEHGLNWISEYHKNLSEGRNIIVEKDNSSQKIIEQLETLTTDPSKLANNFEGQLKNVMSNITTATDVPNGNESSLMPILQKLWHTVTEGGSPIGILHLILDVIGIVGDAGLVFGMPIGVVADLINASIYAYRAMDENDNSKWVLAIISMIAGVIPGAGDALKATFKGTKAGQQTLKVVSRYWDEGVGGARKIDANMTDKAAAIFKGASPETIKNVKYLTKNAKTAIPKAVKILKKFFVKFLKAATGWLPFIGKPLRKFFDDIIKKLDDFAEITVKASDDLTEAAAKSSMREVDDFLSAAAESGSKIESGTHGGLRVKLPDGTFKLLDPKHIKNMDMITSRYGKTLTKEIKNTNMNLSDFYSGIAKVSEQVGRWYDKPMRIGAKLFTIHRGTVLFLAKQFIKMAASIDGLTGELSEPELEAVGNAMISTEMQRKMKEERKKDPKVKYSVPILDPLKDNESVEMLRKYQNQMAERFGLPSIIKVVRPSIEQLSKKKDNKEAKDAKKFIDTMYGGQGVDSMYESKSLKYITPFKL